MDQSKRKVILSHRVNEEVEMMADDSPNSSINGSVKLKRTLVNT